MDEIVRAMTKDGFVKAAAITSTGICERARQIQKSSPTATAALGRLLTAASIMGNMQKVDNGSVTLRVQGGGPIGTMLAVSDSVGNVRGYVTNPAADAPSRYPGKLDVGAIVGTDGMLTVIRDLQMKEPYIGSVQLMSGEIAEDVTMYFAQSEQTPTACGLGVLVDTDKTVKVAGGYLLQLLPGAPEEVIAKLEGGIRKALLVTALLERGMTAQQLLDYVLEGFEVEYLETTPVEYRCYCSRERVENTLRSLSAGELQSMADSGEPARVECQFCDTVYSFDASALERLIEQKRQLAARAEAEETEES